MILWRGAKTIKHKSEKKLFVNWVALQYKYAGLQPLLHIHIERQLIEEGGQEGAVGVVGHDKESYGMIPGVTGCYHM